MPEEKSKEQLMKEMDDAAKEAQVELIKNYKTWSCRDLATWWVKWYLKAGHKRLGRAMVQLDKMVKGLGS